MSTTETKRDVIDYLWEWAEETGNWAKILVQKVVQKEGHLVEAERDEVYSAFLQGIGLGKKGQEIPEITRPAFSASAADIELVKISDICGVNRLASKQSLEFSKDMTVVYGENGTGKTGYGRVLKNFGYCYDAETKIHPDVNGGCSCKQSALIDYKTGGTDQVFTWDGANECIDLAGISFFNNNCVSLSLDGERTLLVSPIGFHLFTVMIKELDELSKLHKAKIATIDTSLSWKDSLHDETEVQNFVSSLSKKTKDKDIDDLALFRVEHEADLQAKKDEIKKVNKELLSKEITDRNQHITELDRLIKIIKGQQTKVSEETLKEFAANLTSLGALKSKEQVGLKDVVEEKGVQLYDSPEFIAFIKAADQYITKIGKKDYPSGEEDVCVYCQQKLSDKSSLELLQSYRKLLNETTQQDIAKVTKNIKNFADIIALFSEENKFNIAVYGIDDDSASIQPDFLKTYNSAIEGLKKVVMGRVAKDVADYKFAVPFDDTISTLEAKKEEIGTSLANKKETLSNLNEVEAKLQKAINELEDRKTLSENMADVTTALAKFKIKYVLESNSKLFSSRKISDKTTAARNELVADEFQKTFEAELKFFRRSNAPVSMSFKTDKGQSKIVQSISDSYKLNEILSEGEQKAIALAEFLTELQFDKGKSPAVFDDPVTSLDHKIIDEVARRLLKLSKERQVIIFTHSILLLNSIRQLSTSPLYSGVMLNMYEVQMDEKNTGYLERIRAPKEESFNKFKADISNIFNLPAEERDSKRDQLAADGYGLLRSAIEVLVESHVLCGTVRRYQKNVAVTNFEKIKTDKIDEHRENLSIIFSRCCGFIDGHTNPDEIPDKPDLYSLKADFDAVQVIFKAFN